MTNQQIRDAVGKAALFEQLAEEAAELAHAALKYARIIRGENPTPVNGNEAFAAVIDEISDVTLCADICGAQPDLNIMYEKRSRWVERIEDAEDEAWYE